MFNKMMMWSLAILMATMFSLPEARAGNLKNGKKDRQGFLLGFGAGGGLFNLRGGGDAATKGAFLFDVKIGGALNEKILLMYNGSSQYTKIDGVTFLVTTAPFAVQWFAFDNFYIRPGVGITRATASISAGGTTVSTASKISFGADFATGYEFRLGKRLGLSPELVYHYAHLRSSGTNGNAHSIGAQASLIWYF